jgi:hypothetical protein
MRNKILLCSLLFAFVFSFSLGFHTVSQAGDDPVIPEVNPCLGGEHIGNCCVDPVTLLPGVCVQVGSGVVCECTCIHVNWPTCDGPQGCEYDVCSPGTGS